MEKKKNLKDEFAMAALTGMLASDKDEYWLGHLKELTLYAYKIADEMMIERARGE